MSYQYSALPDARSWVRLITVDKEPFRPNSDPSLWCHIKEFPISSAPPYKALSYEWGLPSPDNNASVYVEYCSLGIRKPLYKFLQRLAGSPDHDSTAYFFADGICMNQDDKEEKDLQILLMGQVFSQATAVYCWLGEPDRQDHQLLNALTSANASMAREETSRRMRSSLLEMDYIYGDKRLDVHNRKHLEHRVRVITMMANFVRKSYFSRLWMAQEMILAKRLQLYCGEHTFDWRQLEHWLPHYGPGGSRDCILDLFGAFSQDEGISYDENGTQQVAQWLIQPPWEKEWRELRDGRVGTIIQWRDSQGRRSLVAAIDQFGFSGCERPRDRVWGLLGLITKETSEADFPVDNKKSPITVFFDTLLYCRADLGSHTIKFAKKLYAMLELDLSAVVDCISGSCPPAMRSANPKPRSFWSHAASVVSVLSALMISPIQGLIAELEQETMISRPSSRRLTGYNRDLWSFSLRASSDLSAISINELMGLTLASASQVTAISFDKVGPDDRLFRIRGTSYGLICCRNDDIVKGRYVVAKTKDTTAALRFLAQISMWCKSMKEVPDLTKDEVTGALRGRIQIIDIEDLLIFATDVEGGTYNGQGLPMGWGL